MTIHLQHEQLIYQTPEFGLFSGQWGEESMDVFCLKSLGTRIGSTLQQLFRSRIIETDREENLLLPLVDGPEMDDAPFVLVRNERGVGFSELLGTRVSLEKKMQFSRALIGALEWLHQKDQYLTDFHPALLRYFPERQQVRFIHLVFAPQNTFAEAGMGFHEWNIPYIAPEQTGRTLQKPDYRSNYYSLGVILYEVFTGQHPLHGTDPLELIHQHMARRPTAPEDIRPELGKALSAVILKLLAKNPEERYLSLHGLREDMDKAWQILQKGNLKEEFQLGTADFPETFLPPERIVGRENELADVGELLERLNAQNVFLCVQGKEGVGKTALVQNVEKRYAHRGRFVFGRYEPARSLPFDGFRQIVVNLVEQVITLPDEERRSLEHRLRKKVRNLEDVLLEFAPELSAVLSKADNALPEIEGEAAFNRFQFAISNFLQSFATAGRPLILVLTNLTHADTTSLRLLEGLLADPELQHFAVLATCRSGDDLPEPFTRFMDRMKTLAAGRPSLQFGEIELGGVQVNDILALLETVRKADRETLAQILYQKTGGNPLFFRQLLRQFADQSFFLREPDQKSWRVDLAAAADAPVTNNLVGLLETRMENLNPTERMLLQMAATIGQDFDPDLLLQLCGLDPKSLSQRLARLEFSGLIFRSSTFSPFGMYKFAHQRLISSLQETTGAAKRQEWAPQILQFYLDQMEDSEVEAHLFDLVAYIRQMAPTDRRHYSPLLERAAKKAIRQSAFDNALRYYQHILKVFPAKEDTSSPDQWFHYHVAATTSAIYAQQYALAEQWLALIHSHATTLDEQIEWYYLKALSAVNQEKMRETVQVTLAGLKLLGVRFPFEPPLWRIVWSLIQMGRLFKGKTQAFIEQLPVSKDTNLVHYNRLLTVSSAAIYFAAPKLLALIAELRIRDTLEKGMHPYSPSAMVGYGFLLSSFTPKVAKGFEVAQMGMELNEKFGLPALEPFNRFLYSTFVEHAQHSIYRVGENLLDNYRACREIGNTNIAFYSLGVGMHYLLYSGEDLERLREIAQRHLKTARDANQDMIGEYLLQVLQFASDLRQDHFPQQIFEGPYFSTTAADLSREIDQSKNSDTTLRALFITLSYLKGDYGAVHTPGEKLLLYSKERGHSTVHANFNVFFILAARLKDSGKVRKGWVRKWKKKLELWAQSAPENYGPLNKVLDGLAQENWGRGVRAGEAYRTAYNLALTGNNPFIVGIVAEEYGRYLYESAGEQTLGKRILQEAFDRFGRWQATAKQAQLRDRYPDVYFATQDAARSGRILAQHLDLSSLLKASSTISREIRQQPLIDRLLGVLIENAGAERAAFFVPHHDQLTLLAVKHEGTDVACYNQPAEQVAFPSQIVHFVWEKQEPLLLQDAIKDHTFGADPYIREHQIRSVACFPLIRQDDLKALIYLENKWTPRVFGPERLELLELLSSQMTISYENAQLYEQLEEKVQDRTRDLNEEKEKVDSLLENIMPKEVAEELKEQGRVRARRYEEVSVLFTDFKNFTLLAQKLQAEELVDLLDFYFSEFDRIILRYGLEKIKTIGDAYMCAGGIPTPERRHLHRIVKAGLDIRDFVGQVRTERQSAGLPFFEMRLGIHVGPVVAGIVGHQKFAYDIWGETVNVAARMESNGAPGKINVSQECYELVKDDFACTFHGIFQAKTNQPRNMYWLNRK